MAKKKLMVKILIPVLIAIAIIMIWVVKTNSTPTIDDKGNSGDLATSENEEDFILEVTSIDMETLTGYGLPIIIDFGADSCVPCKEMAPVLVAINSEMQGKAIIKFVDVWKYAEAAEGYPLQVIPTQVFINDDGTPYVPSEGIGIDFTMYSTKDTNEHVFTVHQGGLTEDQMRLILADMGVEG